MSSTVSASSASATLSDFSPSPTATTGTTDPVARRTIHVPLDQCEWRDSGDPEKPNETTLRGHAAVFNSLSDDLGGFRELVAPGFFRAALRKQPDVRLLFNHDPNYVMGRTAAGTLELREDNRGLHVFARVDKTIGWVADLRTSMQRGDVDQMSFAFTVREGGDDWAVTDDDQVIRTLLPDGAAELFDVSVVTYPAYKATEVSMRSLLDEAIASGRLPETAGATPGTATGIADDDRGVVSGVEEQREQWLANLQTLQPKLGQHLRQMGMGDMEEPDDVDLLLCMISNGVDFLDGEEDPDGQAAMQQILNLLLGLLTEEIGEEPDAAASMEAASHVDALAELRTASKQTLQVEKEHLAHLLRKAVT